MSELRFYLLCLAVVLASACATLPRTTTATHPLPRLAIMQGVTGDDYTQVLVLTQGSAGYRYVLADAQGKKLSPTEVKVSQHDSSAWRVQRVVFNNLKPNSSYLLRVYQHDKLRDARSLSTRNPQRRKLRLAFASCMDDRTPQDDIWQQMLALRPDVIFLIGDNVYADKHIKGIKYGTKSWHVMASPADLWHRYVETRNTIDLFKSEELVPVVATWDDHDYGINNGGRDYPYQQEALRGLRCVLCQSAERTLSTGRLGHGGFF